MSYYTISSAEAMEKIMQQQKEMDLLKIRLKRTVNASYNALLEMSAWMGIPEKKRHAQIEELMSNVKFCAENNMSEDKV